MLACMDGTLCGLEETEVGRANQKRGWNGGRVRVHARSVKAHRQEMETGWDKKMQVEQETFEYRAKHGESSGVSERVGKVRDQDRKRNENGST
jgi:hypothetical protein